jgi:putative phosphonate metabolism protein
VRRKGRQDVTARAAIYYTAPQDSDLSTFAAAWLGRDVAAGRDVARRPIAGIDAARQEEITRSPRHYGFHATLKAPFELGEEQELEDLRHALANFVVGRRPVEAPPLVLSDLYGFLALTLSAPSPEVDALAGDCVDVFERFRAPLSEDDLARRREADLTPHQEALLLRWGYPYVFDEFRFHMTLTERLEDDERRMVQAALTPHVAPLCEAPLVVDGVSLVAQPDRTSPFVVVARFPLLA